MKMTPFKQGKSDARKNIDNLRWNLFKGRKRRDYHAGYLYISTQYVEVKAKV